MTAPAAAPPRLILIAGTSHTGKSTLAAAFARHLAWPTLATDGLARHPGRPWGRVRPDVARYYRDHEVRQLVADVERHYRSLAGRVEDLVREHFEDRTVPGLVVEGSALMPATVARLMRERGAAQVLALWLSPAPGVLRMRMRASAAYNEIDAARRLLVDRFLARAEAFEARQLPRAVAARLTVVVIRADVSMTPPVEDLLAP